MTIPLMTRILSAIHTRKSRIQVGLHRRWRGLSWSISFCVVLLVDFQLLTLRLCLLRRCERTFEWVCWLVAGLIWNWFWHMRGRFTSMNRRIFTNWSARKLLWTLSRSSICVRSAGEGNGRSSSIRCGYPHARWLIDIYCRRADGGRLSGRRLCGHSCYV